MLKDKIITIIPARGGSKGIHNKNIVDVMGFPLIAYSIVASLTCKSGGRTIVDTDSEEIAQIAREYGAEVPYIRPKHFASDSSLDKDWVNHAVKWFEDNENFKPKYIVHLRPTTPFRDVVLLEAAIAKIIQVPEATSLRSVQRLEESPYKMFQKDEGFLKPYINYGEGEFYNLPRQSFPHAFYPNGYIDILKRETLNKGSLHGDKILSFETPKVTELDCKDDLKQLHFEGKHSPIYYCLKFNDDSKKS